jgi:hypothetical protein
MTKQAGAKPRKRVAGKERLGTGATDAKWRGKGFTHPSPAIYRSGGAALPRTARAARIYCRRPRLPLTEGPYRAEMVRCAHMHDHYGAGTEGPRRSVMSAPHVVHYARGCAA